MLNIGKILETNINVTNMEDTISYITEHLEHLKGDYIGRSNGPEFDQIFPAKTGNKFEVHIEIAKLPIRFIETPKPPDRSFRRKQHLSRVHESQMLGSIWNLSLCSLYGNDR